MPYKTTLLENNGTLLRKGIFIPEGPLVGIVRSEIEDNCIAHKHDFEELAIIISGKARHHVGSYTYDIQSGDVFVITEGQGHGFSDAHGLAIINIEYDRCELISCSGDLKGCPGFYSLFSSVNPADSTDSAAEFSSHFLLNNKYVSVVIDWVDEIERELSSSEPGYQTICKSNFLKIVTLLSRNYYSYSENVNYWRVSQILAYMENNYSKDVLVEDLADLANLSVRQLFRVFKDSTGVSPLNYLLNIRIEKAIKILCTSNLPVGSVSAMVGISDSNYFSRMFKKYTGQSPSSYRKE